MIPRPPTFAPPLTLVLALTLLLAACGGDDAPNPAADDPPSQQTSQQEPTGPDEDPTRVADDEPPARVPVRVDVPAANQTTQAGQALPAATAGDDTIPAGLDVERTGRAVVRVETALLADDDPQIIGFGTGSIVDPSGLILTNFHVVDPGIGYDRLQIALVGALDASPVSTYIADIQVADELLDLAVLRIVATVDGQPIKPEELHLPTLPLGDSDAVQLLDRVLAFGFPDIGDDTLTVTAGAISGFLSQPGVDDPRAWFKTDTTISFGNSGGAAVNERGQLVAVPTQGRSNTIGSIAQLRPIAFALPLIETARRGETDVPVGSVARVVSPIYDLAFAPALTDDGALAGPVNRFPTGAGEIFYAFRFQGLEDGLSWTDRWRHDGDLIPELSEPRPPWALGEAGAFVGGISQEGGFDNGVYTLEILIDDEVAASRSLVVGDAELPPLELDNFRFAGDLAPDGTPIDLRPSFPAGARRLVAIFDYANAGLVTNFEARWLRDDEEVGRVGPGPWDGGASGSHAVWLFDDRGLAPGTYSLELIFNNVLEDALFIAVGLEQSITGSGHDLAVGAVTDGDLSQGDIAIFRLVDLAPGRPLAVAITGTGDADLYVKRGEQVRPAEFGRSWDEPGFQAPFVVGSDENVFIPNIVDGEEWFVAVAGFDVDNTFTLSVEQPPAGAGLPTLVEGEPAAGILDEAIPARQYLIDVPPGVGRLTLTSTGSADIDIYLRPGQPVTPAQTGAAADGPGLFAPYTLGAAETIDILDPVPGDWFLLVDGFELPAAYTVRLAFDTLVDAPAPRPLAAAGVSAGELTLNERVDLTFDYGGGDALLAFAMGGDGDADLYVKFGAPLAETELGRPWNTPGLRAHYLPGSNENVLFADPDPGRYHVTVVGAADANTYELVVYEIPAFPPDTLELTPLDPGIPETFVLRLDEAPMREVVVPPGAALLSVAMEGSGDADLVLRYLEPADPSQFDAPRAGPELWLPYRADSAELINIVDPLPGVYVLHVVGAAQEQVVTVTTTLD